MSEYQTEIIYKVQNLNEINYIVYYTKTNLDWIDH